MVCDTKSKSYIEMLLNGTELHLLLRIIYTNLQGKFLCTLHAFLKVQDASCTLI
jgi:hypothetical protein